MKRLIVLALVLCAAFGAWAKDAQPLADDPELEQRLIAISDEMRCLVCQNESLSGSRSELANDLRREIREQLRKGRTDDEIREYMVARYGDFVLYRPPVKASTWLLWGGPFAILVIALGVLIGYLRRRNTEVKDEVLDEEQAKRADALLREDAR
jgi:cytochrome c-type biogenesis protein CcmH